MGHTNNLPARQPAFVDESAEELDANTFVNRALHITDSERPEFRRDRTGIIGGPVRPLTPASLGHRGPELRALYRGGAVLDSATGIKVRRQPYLGSRDPSRRGAFD